MSYSSTHVSVIIGVREQDPKRWRQFNDLYRPMLMDYLRRRNLPEFDADDVVQDVFVKLISKINTYEREKCCFRSWLFAVVNHSLIDAARRKAAHVKAQEGWVVNVLRSTPTESVMLEEAWRKLHQERILKHALKAVRARVSPRAWACFVQRVFNDHPAAQIGHDLGIGAHAVYVNACRVMKLVRKYCLDFDEDMSHAFESDVS